MLNLSSLLNYLGYFLFAISIAMFLMAKKAEYRNNGSFHLVYTIVCWLLATTLLRGLFVDIDYLSLGFGVWGIYAGYKSFQQYRTLPKKKRPKKPNIKLMN